MANNRRPITISVAASADLSASQYRAVYLVGIPARAAVDTSNATAPIGIMLNKPAAAGRAAEIAILGVAKMEAGAAVAAGQRVTQVAGGRGSPTLTAVDEVVGLALTAAAGSGELFEVLVNPSRAGTAVYSV